MKEKAFSEALLVRYLLGDLPEEEQVKIEDRAFQDREYLQDILAVENDLIDEYVRGELSDSERRQFEGRFLASAERRRKVEFARALTALAPGFAVIEKDARSGARPAPISRQSALVVRDDLRDGFGSPRTLQQLKVEWEMCASHVAPVVGH